jgi:nucleoside-diphosphate-sugar epimerase
MKIFVAGATGALGRKLIPLLVQAGHSVVGMTRSPGKTSSLRAAGAEPVVADALDADAVMAAVRKAAPEVVVHQLTALPAMLDFRKIEQQFALTNRLRAEGTDHLMAAALTVGARRFVAQSFAGWPYARTGGPVKTEMDPLDTDPPAALRKTLMAIRHLETTVTGAPGIEGIVLRYGGFYGPGNAIGEGGALLEQIRQRRVPVVGGGGGVWSFVHIDDAARATLAAIERRTPGIYNFADDDPAPVSVWLPALASALGAKPPRHIPAWLAKFLIGEQGIMFMTEVRGASNAKAKRELGWQPAWASWRDGFTGGVGENNSAVDRGAERVATAVKLA